MTCPICNGDHLDGLRYQHRTWCEVYRADTPTINNDHQHVEGTRPARDHERTIIDEQDHEQPGAGEQYGIRFRHDGGVHTRNVVILDETGDYLRDAQRAGDAGDA